MRKSPTTHGAGSEGRIAPVRDALSLWQLLNRKGRLSPKTHDEKFVDDLRSALRVPVGEEIADFLSRMRPDTTTFMLAVLNAFEPFGRMLSDIYGMFARQGLKASDDKVLIEFDFGKAHDKLKFDADHFRKTLDKVSKLLHSIDVHQFTAKDLRGVNAEIGEALADANGQPPAPHVFERTLGHSSLGQPIRLSSEPQSQALATWLQTGLEAPGRSNRWPYFAPPPMPGWSPGDPVRHTLMPFINATLSLCTASGRYPTWQAMRDAAKAAGAPDEPGNGTRSSVAYWSLGATALHQQDRLAEFNLRLIWHVYELAPSETQAREELARRIARAIVTHSNRVEVLAPAKALEELLDLPMWEFRHQIYSIWLVTIVERAFLDPDQCALAGEDGRLVFAFAKTLVARLRARGVDMELISELRTPAGKLELTGKGRKGSVQPDYVVRRFDAEGKEHVVYVLEAKQYEKASLQNFARALRDYAAVHKQSLVALVNYGPMSTSIAEKVGALTAEMKDKGVAERCTAFGKVEPTFPESVSAVRNHIRSALTSLPVPTDVQRPTLIIDVSGSMSSVLPDDGNGYSKGVWGAIGETGMPVLITAQGFQQEYTGAHSLDAAHLSRKHLQDTAFRMEDVDPNRRKGALLLTDKSGLKETAAFHHELAAVIVLHGDDRATIYVSPKYRAELDWTIPELFKSAAVASMDLL